nr:hypothetical protein CFP56_15909 [Quercus suber]
MTWDLVEIGFPFLSKYLFLQGVIRFTSPSAKANNDNNTDLFNSLISDIKSYSGNDPLLPWLRRKNVEFASKRFLIPGSFKDYD